MKEKEQIKNEPDRTQKKYIMRKECAKRNDDKKRTGKTEQKTEQKNILK